MAKTTLTVTVWIECPVCQTVIDVPIAAELTHHDGRQYLNCDPDMADLWAHAWTHEDTEAGQ